MDELGPITRAEKAEVALAASEAQRIIDNEGLLEQIGELKGEVARLKGMEDLAFEMGTHLKVLVTSLCPIVRANECDQPVTPAQWDTMEVCWAEAREKLRISPSGVAVSTEGA